MPRGAHSEHTTAIWAINVPFFNKMELRNAIWRIALLITLKVNENDGIRLNVRLGAQQPSMKDSTYKCSGTLNIAPLAQTAGPEHSTYLPRIAPIFKRQARSTPRIYGG